MRIAMFITALVTLHMVDGRPVRINPELVTQLYQPREDHPHKEIIDKVKCVVRLADGSFVSVSEGCDEVRRIVEGDKK